jgi:hypothetical protein
VRTVAEEEIIDDDESGCFGTFIPFFAPCMECSDSSQCYRKTKTVDALNHIKEAYFEVQLDIPKGMREELKKVVERIDKYLEADASKKADTPSPTGQKNTE